MSRLELTACPTSPSARSSSTERVSSCVRSCSSWNSRTFSMAITAWSANVSRSPTCRSVKSANLGTADAIVPIATPSRVMGTLRAVRWPHASRVLAALRELVRVGLQISDVDGPSVQHRSAIDHPANERVGRIRRRARRRSGRDGRRGGADRRRGGRWRRRTPRTDGPRSPPRCRAPAGCRSASCEMTRRISLVAVCCSSASVRWWLVSASSRVRASTFCSRPSWDSLRLAVMRLNELARASISSPVDSSIGWSSRPAPIRAAPSWRTRIGATIRRARKRLARIERPRPSTKTTALRMIGARRGAYASAAGRSTKTKPPRGAMAACAARTCPPPRPSATIATGPSPVVPERSARADSTCARPERSRFSRSIRVSGWATSWLRESTT